MAKGKIEVNSERCKGCELCVSVCPEQILRLSETFNRQGQRYAECFAPERCCGSRLPAPGSGLQRGRRPRAPCHLLLSNMRYVLAGFSGPIPAAMCLKSLSRKD